MNIPLDFLVKFAARSLQLAGHPVVIDRPKGYAKTFPTEKGPITLKYPVDYGYFKGIINPEDQEEADVFIGHRGPLHGKYMKGKTEGGKWKPDEHKWYTGLTQKQYDEMMNLFSLTPGLIRQHKTFPSGEHVLADVKSLTQKRAYWNGFFKAAANTPQQPTPVAPLHVPQKPPIRIGQQPGNNFSFRLMSEPNYKSLTSGNSLTIDAHGGPDQSHGYGYAYGASVPSVGAKVNPTDPSEQGYTPAEVASAMGTNAGNVHNLRVLACNPGWSDKKYNNVDLNKSYNEIATPKSYQQQFPNVTNITMAPPGTYASGSSVRYPIGDRGNALLSLYSNKALAGLMNLFQSKDNQTPVSQIQPLHNYNLQGGTNWIDTGAAPY